MAGVVFFAVIPSSKFFEPHLGLSEYVSNWEQIGPDLAIFACALGGQERELLGGIVMMAGGRSVGTEGERNASRHCVQTASKKGGV